MLPEFRLNKTEEVLLEEVLNDLSTKLVCDTKSQPKSIDRKNRNYQRIIFNEVLIREITLIDLKFGYFMSIDNLFLFGITMRITRPKNCCRKLIDELINISYDDEDFLIEVNDKDITISFERPFNVDDPKLRKNIRCIENQLLRKYVSCIDQICKGV